MFHRFGIWDTIAISAFPFVFQLIEKLLMSVFTFSPVCSMSKALAVSPSVFFSLSGCQTPSALPNLSSPAHHPSPWGSLCVQHRPAAPPHVLHCSHPPFSPCVVVICFVLKGMRCRGGLGLVPFHSASALRFSPDCFCPHFCSELKRPCRRNVLLSSHSSSGCIFSVGSPPKF